MVVFNVSAEKFDTEWIALPECLECRKKDDAAHITSVLHDDFFE